MTDSPVVCPVCHGDGFIVEEYRRFADGGAYIESFDTDCPKCRRTLRIFNVTELKIKTESTDG